MIEMKVSGIVSDPVTKKPIALLKDEDNSVALPMYIEEEEAKAIKSILEKNPPPRPRMHDLFANFLQTWEMNLEKVIIHSLQDDIYYTVLCVGLGEQKKEIDCRPSDAIAIALRTNSPIFVMEQVIADAL